MKKIDIRKKNNDKVNSKLQLHYKLIIIIIYEIDKKNTKKKKNGEQIGANLETMR